MHQNFLYQNCVSKLFIISFTAVKVNVDYLFLSVIVDQKCFEGRPHPKISSSFFLALVRAVSIAELQ